RPGAVRLRLRLGGPVPVGLARPAAARAGAAAAGPVLRGPAPVVGLLLRRRAGAGRGPRRARGGRRRGGPPAQVLDPRRLRRLPLPPEPGPGLPAGAAAVGREGAAAAVPGAQPAVAGAGQRG